MKKAFKVNFIVFKGLSGAKNCLRPERASLTLFRMGLFWAAHRGGGGFLAPLPKICLTYPTMMKLGTVIPYHRKIQKMYKSRATFLEFC